MAVASSMSPRGTALARTFAAAFAALAEHQKRHIGEASILVDQICAHTRSAWPMESQAPVYVPPSAEDQAELAKLRAEVETMRPVFVAAIEWRDNRDHGSLLNVLDGFDGQEGK